MENGPPRPITDHPANGRNGIGRFTCPAPPSPTLCSARIHGAVTGLISDTGQDLQHSIEPIAGHRDIVQNRDIELVFRNGFRRKILFVISTQPMPHFAQSIGKKYRHGVVETASERPL